MDFIKILEILADTKGPIIHFPKTTTSSMRGRNSLITNYYQRQGKRKKKFCQDTITMKQYRPISHLNQLSNP